MSIEYFERRVRKREERRNVFLFIIRESNGQFRMMKTGSLGGVWGFGGGVWGGCFGGGGGGGGGGGVKGGGGGKGRYWKRNVRVRG